MLRCFKNVMNCLKDNNLLRVIRFQPKVKNPTIIASSSSRDIWPFSCMNAESDTKKMGLALSDIHYIECTFASFIVIFQYSLIVMSRVDFFLSDSTYVIGSRIVVVCVSHFSPLLRFFFYNRPFKTLVIGKFSEEKIVDD